MSQPFRWTLLWIAGAAIGAISALMMLSQSYDYGIFFPANPDAAYHARRILDAVFTGQAVIQFDSKIHVPEGSWLTWPWGFDQLMAWITRAFGPYQNEPAANRVLMNIPPAAMPIAVGLVVIIARQLKLSLMLATPLVLGFAALPVVYMAFGVGNIDHHFAELMWTLGTISAGLWFMREEGSAVRGGVALGVVLGTAMAIHNGLFILQIPVAIALCLRWLRNQTLPDRRAVIAFAVALLATTTLICIPSIPWRRGFFEFYTLSWFHFYIAACVAVFSVLLTMVERKVRNVIALVVAAGLALLPIVGTLPFAKDFVTGDLAAIQDILEVDSPYKLYREYGPSMSTHIISWLMWVSAPLALVNLWWLVRRREMAIQYVAIVGILGLSLLQAQYRFCVFGAFSMVLTPVLAVRMLIDAYPQWRGALTSGCAAMMLVAFYPTSAGWHFNWQLGNDTAYPNLLPAFPRLNASCAKQPGIVLTEINAGHWIRYHSNCSVIGDVFLLTKLHAEKARETERLLQMTPQQLLDAHTAVRYVLPYHRAPFGLDENGREAPDLEIVRQQFLPPMERDLLGPEDQIPKQFHKLWESRTPAGRVFARLYEIVPSP